ncbi:MAG: sensor domain-containing diguanylate cyclase [Actinobacteria bacterium]|nr:sensor domain-containing diguanylate cyclase [Actinomycetota bacterium]
MNGTGRKSYIHAAYSLAVTAIGLGLLIKLFGSLDLDKSREYAVLIVMGIMVEWLAVNFPLGRLSGSFSLMLGALLIYNPGASAWISSVAFFIGNGIAGRGNSVRTSVFNMAQQVLALYGSVLLFGVIWKSNLDGVLWSGPAGFLQLITLITLFFAINHALVYLYAYPGRKGARMHSWQNTLKWDILSYLFSAPFGIVMAVLYQKTGILAAFLLFLPILTVQYILGLYVRSELVNKELRAVYEINRKLGSGGDFRKIPGLLLREMRRAISFHTGVVYLWQEKTRKFVAAAAFGPYRSQLEKGFVNPGEGFWGWVTGNGEAEIVFDSKIDPRVKNEQGLPQVLRSLLVIPLVGEAGTLGLIIVGEKKAMAFTEQDLAVAMSLCGSLSAALSGRVLAEKLERYGSRDPMTGLLNRSSLYRSGVQAFEEIKSSGEGCAALLLMDIDMLEHINEGWGQESGDRMIIELARVVKSLEIPGARAGRFGDDELGLILPGFDEHKAVELANEIRDILSDYTFAKEYPLLRIKVSIGAAAGGPEEVFDQLVIKAGQALRKAKKDGRDRVLAASELKGRYSGRDSWLT